MLGFWILLLLFAALILSAPWWPYSREWGYWPGSAVAAVIAVWLVLIWFGWVVFVLPWAAPAY